MTEAVPELQIVLAPLVGQPLSGTWRPACQRFEFGARIPFVNRKGDTTTLARYLLSAYQEWRVLHEAVVVLGSDDHPVGKKRRFYDRKTPPSEASAQIRWQRAKDFFERVDRAILLVREVSPTGGGNLSVTLTDGYRIEMTGCSSYPEQWVWVFDDDVEGWSCFVQSDTHYVSDFTKK